MNLAFTKMHGLGNDFVVLDGVTQDIHLSEDQVRLISNRQLGVGCDQVLLVEPPQQPDMDFRYRIFNADGSEVEQCGNGARCFALYVQKKRLTHKQTIHVETMNANIELHIEQGQQVRVDMGEPLLAPEKVPFTAPKQQLSYPLTINTAGQSQSYSLGVVSMGNPHRVLCVNDVANTPVENIGSLLSHHPDFPNSANIGFMEVVNRNHIKLRVYERGAGETLACGTGACAAVVIGVERDLLQSPVTVDLPGGSLIINYNKSQGGHYHKVFMTGPAEFVFEGKINL
ncbi:MAG: diaminopimelate epimerase [Gammaproteobacteria bacterium]|nr:diaminopimelate epimerase [Gammaproteobacteria bacterium]